MKLYYDFHIHTALSPCGDTDMTPNNIVNMALIKGLEAIAVTDHNSCSNAVAVMKASEGSGLTVIGGMELECAEEIHAVCLFPDIDSLIGFEALVNDSLPVIKNNEKIFGRQIVYNEFDEEIGVKENLLSQATQIGFDDAFSLVAKYSGILIPAHIDRPSYSVISSLGVIPDYLPIKCVELSKIYKEGSLDVKDYTILRSSDAHYIEDMSERENFLEIDFAPTPKNIIEFLKR